MLKQRQGKQYVDGELVSEIDYTGKLGDFAFAKIGRQGTETWEGSIDEVAVFNQPLAKADIEKVIIEKNAGSGVVPYLPLPELKKKATN